MKRADTNYFSKQILRSCLFLVFIISSLRLSGQCSVNITGPAEQTYCIDETITFAANVTAGTAPFTYSWNSGGSGPTETVTAPAYTWYIEVTVTDANGCVAVSNQMIVRPVFWNGHIYTTSGLICVGQGGSVLLESGGVGIDSWVWSTGETTPSISVYSPGPYGLTITDATTGCSREMSLDPQLFIDPPDPFIEGPVNLCEGATATLFLTGLYSPPYSYLWQPNGETVEEISVNAPGAYSVEVTDLFGCTGEDEIIITQLPATPARNKCTCHALPRRQWNGRSDQSIRLHRFQLEQWGNNTKHNRLYIRELRGNGYRYKWVYQCRISVHCGV